MFVATHWPNIDQFKPDTGWPIPRFGTVMHISIYAGWVVMWWWLLSAGGQTVGRKAIIWLIIGGTFYAVFDESSQAIVARNPALDDFLANIIGLIVANFVLYTWQRLK